MRPITFNHPDNSAIQALFDTDDDVKDNDVEPVQQKSIEEEIAKIEKSEPVKVQHDGPLEGIVQAVGSRAEFLFSFRTSTPSQSPASRMPNRRVYPELKQELTQAHIGQELVRVHPSRNGDWSSVPDSQEEFSIFSERKQLVELSSDKMVLYYFLAHCYIELEPALWNDGFWVPVETLRIHIQRKNNQFFTNQP